MAIDLNDVSEKVYDIVRQELCLTMSPVAISRGDRLEDLGAEDDDLNDINDDIERVFNIEGFDAAWDPGVTVGDLIDAVIDVLQHVPASGPGA